MNSLFMHTRKSKMSVSSDFFVEDSDYKNSNKN